MVVAYAGLCGGGYYLLRWLREQWEMETRRAVSRRREELTRQTAAAFAKLQTIGDAIAGLGTTVGLKLSCDHAAEAAAVFRSLMQRYWEHSDGSLIRAALAITERRLLRQKRPWRKRWHSTGRRWRPLPKRMWRAAETRRPVSGCCASTI
jgi:hypothetical protein